MNEITHLSYSSISAYLSCPALWKFRYIDKLPVPVSPNLFFGSVWHNTIEEYISVSASGKDALLDMYNTWWKRQMDSEGHNIVNESEIDAAYDQGYLWIYGPVEAGEHTDMASFLDTIKPKQRKNAGENEKPLYVEEKITLNVPGVPVPIIGYIDVITQDDIPTDFKTSSKAWTNQKAEDEMQPLFYLAALSQAGIRVPGRKFRHIVFTKTKTPKVQIIETSHNMAKLLWLYRVIEGVWDAIDKGAFPVNPTGWQCSPRWCDYYSSCRGKFDGV